MKAEDMGINLEPGSHSQAFTWYEATVMEILSEHMGAKNKISRRDFTEKFNDMLLASGYDDQISMRQAQKLIDHLIIDHHHQGILTKAGAKGGYWLSESREEAKEFFETFERRGKSAFLKATRGEKGVLVNLVEQLTFGFDEARSKSGRAWIRPYHLESTPAAVVTAFLDRMTKEPDKYDAELKLLGEKHGKVLMPREHLMKIQQLSKELSGLLDKVA